jgi:Subtilase family
MPGFPRDLPHLYLRGSGRSEPYTSKLQVPQPPAPWRERTVHAETLRSALTTALSAVEVRRREREPDVPGGGSGFYLDFEIPAGSETAAELLEDRRKHIELVAFHQESKTAPARATVFVPDTAADHFLKKIEEYRTQNTKPRKPKNDTPASEARPPRPKNEALVARIQNVALAAVRSLYTDDPSLFPAPGDRIWWEIWIRHGCVDVLDALTRRLDIPAQTQKLVFPDREVRLVYGDEINIARLFLNSDVIAEVRRAKDTPTLFLEGSNIEQASWSADLAARLVPPERYGVAVSVLDTGVTRAHPLLAPALAANDVHIYDPTWPGGDRHGHGTNMAGTALYGDLVPLLTGNGPIPLTHCLESVKVLPDEGQNEPKLYGAITGESIARAEIRVPDRRRAVCLAVTSDIGMNRGRPSSWSAAIDQFCFGDETARRLILVSAGNIRDRLSKAGYPTRNEIEPIENPGQAWNAVTVGAYTEKTNLTDETYAGWEPVAPAGDLCPTSRTSVTWERQWPIKPDIVLEGGNWAAFENQCDCPDDLGILTTYRDPTTRHFDIFRDTSAATALAGNLAGKILAALPERWPETIRALMIHSAEWTPVMCQQFDAATSEQQKRNLLRKYGYGVPSYERAVLSAANDLTLIAEDELQPFWKPAGGSIQTRHMNIHQFPWPRTQLEQLGETEVELRVTLSYYVEPNPGERGWLRRHRYPSHGLRFAVKRALESVNTFRKRINKAARAEEEGLGTIDAGGDDWQLGRIRNSGSVHSDYWRGTAADLARRSAIGVYPVGGWWKENPAHRRYDRTVRYSLIISIRAINAAIDIYTPVRVQITPPIEVPLANLPQLAFQLPGHGLAQRHAWNV